MSVRPVTTVMINQQISSDRQQPCALGRSTRIKPAPGTQGTFERGLRQILGALAIVEPVGKKAVHAPHVLVVHARELP